MQTIFRVDEVLRGDSPTVALIGRDVGDRQVRLEVPAAMVGGVRVGSALVIEWWTAEMPGAAARSATAGPSSPWPRGSGSSTPEAAAGGSAGAATSAASVSSEVGSAASPPFDEARLDQEFRALIGLR